MSFLDSLKNVHFNVASNCILEGVGYRDFPARAFFCKVISQAPTQTAQERNRGQSGLQPCLYSQRQTILGFKARCIKREIEELSRELSRLKPRADALEKNQRISNKRQLLKYLADLKGKSTDR